MSIGSVSGSSPSTQLQVALVKGQQEQEEKVATKLIQSAVDSSKLTGKGQSLNVLA